MKPLALALAAAVLGTGCIVVDDDEPCSQGLTLQWTFELSDGTVTDCFGAGVDWVDVWRDGEFAQSFPCADGAGTVGAWSGAVVTVEGLDALGRIAFRDWVTAPGTCGNAVTAVRPAEGEANLDYSTAVGCASSPCYLWFAVFDYEANDYTAVIDVASSTPDKTFYEYPLDVAILLPAGAHRLEWMQLVSSTFAHQALSCAPTDFDVAGGMLTNVPTTLNAACQ